MNKPSEVDLLGGKRPTFHQNVSRKFWQSPPKYMKVHESTMIVENDHDSWSFWTVFSTQLNPHLKFDCFAPRPEKRAENRWGAQIRWNSLTILQTWGSAHWLAGSARFFLQASRRFPHGLFLPKKDGRNMLRSGGEISPKKSPPGCLTLRHGITNWKNIEPSVCKHLASRDFNFQGSFRSFRVTYIVNHQTPGSIVSQKAANKIFHCLSRQSRLSISNGFWWSQFTSPWWPMFFVLLCVCVWQCVWNLRLAIQRSDHALRTGRRRILSIARCWLHI